MLTWIGTYVDGHPQEHLVSYGIPAADVDEKDLTPEQVALAVASGLYRQEKPGGKKDKE